MSKLAVVVSLVVLVLPLVVVASSAQNDANLERAKRLLKETPVIDGHNDYPWVVREKAGGDVDALDIRKPQPSIHTDIGRLKAGGVGGQFWSVYVPTDNTAASVTATLEQIDIVHRMMTKYPETFALALTAADVEKIQQSGRIPSMIGMEGGHSINSSLGVLRDMYRLGARYMTLTHSLNIPWADSATDTPKLDGLSPFGEQVVREMNRLGMLVDLSHTSPATMADALRITTAPVIFSHSSARGVCDVPRNVPNDILAQLKTNGGVVMVTFVPGFISTEVAAWNRAETAERQRLETIAGTTPEAVTTSLDSWRAAHPTPRATLSQVADHIDHIKKIAGVDHIGLGGDFDGITQVVQGLEDVSTYPALIAELLKRGYTDVDVKKITGGNIMRVMKAVLK